MHTGLTTFIYELIDPRNNESKYIGKANDLVKRLERHLNGREHYNKDKKEWIAELLSLGMTPIINQIDEVPKVNWGYWETWWISIYKSWGINLFNIHPGANEPPTTEEINAKRVEGIKRYWREHPEAKAEKNRKISEGVKNSTVEKWTPELRAKACASQKEASKTRKKAGAILWKEQGLKHWQFKELVQYDLEGKLVNIFYKAEELIPVFGKRLMAGDCCRIGGKLQLEGFVFRYLNPSSDKHLPNTKESVLETIKLIKEKDRRIYQYSLDRSTLIKIWEHVHATNELFKAEQIRKCLRGEKENAFGFYWTRIKLNEL
jgi:hypothetical protein